mmetsp:Transcript_12406/g.26914  ORF Transcript_12406/g.26914 Transcript_12406/m.26914 type:complete len:557 (-) Transcript_12406:216-1886(-)|eukprot:CAMPEP_0172320360 /NCGR_PEP_ID=MMETSP1058-20130122/40381_1 /TAXON_ID=83371 /ORGANISM="Detonula confervacea, Strain CCMP 353" /LENGTH=556 /DNA_ID=CAMNT_0013035615 /DNA_START=373 /DNA_END=2043 /DNA_ORIENTATION=+
MGRVMGRVTMLNKDVLAASTSMANHVNHDVSEFSENFDETAPPVGLDMAGHDTYLLGPKIVMLDSFVVDLLNVDTSAQTFRLKLLVNMDWEDDGVIGPEVRQKRNLGRTGTTITENSEQSSRVAGNGSSRYFQAGGNGRRFSRTASKDESVYKTGKYVLRDGFHEDPLATTWNPNLVLINAIADETPVEAGSKFHSVQMLAGRPVISRSVLYQPECRCAFSFSNFPFDETDLVVKFGSNKWNSEQVTFMWSHRLNSMGRTGDGRRVSQFGVKLKRESVYLNRSVDQNAIGGVGLSEFEIIKVRVECDEKDVNSLQRYDNAEGVFSEAHLIIRVRRDPYSYLLRVASVAELLMFLEFLSFMTDNKDLSARFSISGTIFLAMVSLYGPMADALPKVSVVTRVDKWHLFNFFLLFASNVENLMAFVLRNIVDDKVIEWTEIFLGILYLCFVVKNLIWFIKPLKDREEYSSLVLWFEEKLDPYREKWQWIVDKVFRSWRRKPAKKNNPENRKITRSWGRAVQSVIRMKNGSQVNKSNEPQQQQPPRKTSVGFSLSAEKKD